MGKEKTNVILMSLTWSIMNPFGAAVNTYAILFWESLGADPLIIGIISSAYLISISFSRLIGGYLADAIGRKKTIVYMTVVYGLSNFILALAENWFHILIAQIIIGFSLMYQPAISSLITESLPKEIRARGIAIAGVTGGFTSFFGPPLAILTVNIFGLQNGMRVLYILLAISAIVSSIIRLKLRETLKNSTKVKLKESIEYYKNALKEFKSKLITLTIIFSLIASISGIYGTFIQLFSVSYLGISLTEWGLLVFISQIIGMIGTLLSGYLADKRGRLYVVFLNTVFITISYFMLFLTFLSAFLFVFLATMFIALFNSGPAIEATISERSSEANRGKIFAIFALIRDLLASLVILIAGFVYNLSPKNLIIFGLLLSLSIVFVLKIKLNHTLFPSEVVSGKKVF